MTGGDGDPMSDRRPWRSWRSSSFVYAARRRVQRRRVSGSPSGLVLSPPLTTTHLVSPLDRDGTVAHLATHRPSHNLVAVSCHRVIQRRRWLRGRCVRGDERCSRLFVAKLSASFVRRSGSRRCFVPQIIFCRFHPRRRVTGDSLASHRLLTAGRHSLSPTYLLFSSSFVSSY